MKKITSSKSFLTASILATSILVVTGCSTQNQDTLGDVRVDDPKLLAIDKSSQSNENMDFVLEIIHLNDVHSYILPNSVSLITKDGPIRVKVGGPEAIKSVIDTRRKANPNLLVISAGDQITGNEANYGLFKGEADAALHGLIKENFWVLGNHEFDYGGKGIAKYQEFIKKYAPDDIFINTDVSVGPDSPIDIGVKESFKTIDDHNIVFYGVTTGDKILRSSNPDPDTKFADTVPLINEISAKNQSKAPIQVLISHQGVLSDRKNAVELNDIDIIVGGDSHSLCGDFSKYGLTGECDYPMTLTNASGHKICVVQANEYGKIVGDLRVSFDKDGNVLSCDGAPFLPLWTETAYLSEAKNPKSEENKAIAIKAAEELLSDPNNTLIKAQPNVEAQNAMKPFTDRMSEVYKYLGEATEDLCTTRYPGETCVIKDKPNFKGSETCQVFGMMFKSESAGGDFFISNSGNFRVDTETGDFTDASLLGIIPFGNNIMTTKMKGSELLNLLNQVYRFVNVNPAGRDGGIPCGYGYTYAVDLNNKTHPVSNVKIMDKNGNYQKLVLNKTYDVITTTFVLRGKDGYELMGNKKVVKDNGSDVELVRNYLKKNHTLPLKPAEGTISSFKDKVNK